jgi:hypothetical protein
VKKEAHMKTTIHLTWLCLLTAALTGCAGTDKKGASRLDAFDGVKVDQMTGNRVTKKVFEKTVVCLNARRETRPVLAVTNVVVTSVTNATIVPVTNLTITVSTNFQYTLQTNLAPAQPVTVVAPPEGAPPGETAPPPVVEPATLAVTNVPAALTTNVTLSVANNASAVTAPNQIAANNQAVTTFNSQLTTVTNNLTVSGMTNRIVTAETNQVVNWVTNYSIASVTNISITPTNSMARDYYLLTEIIPPPDFTLASGESLVLLVDGARHGFTQGQAGTSFISRRGFNSTLYKASPETLVAIANAKDVRLRIRGTTSVIEREMNESSRQNLRAFLLKFFTPETPDEPAAPGGKRAALADYSAVPAQ